MILGLFLLGLILFFALIPAAVAERKGRSQLGFFLLSFVATPLVSLIVALIIDPARDFVPPVKVEEIKAPPGHRCGRCGKPLSPAWKGKCEHCKAPYAEFPPVLRLA